MEEIGVTIVFIGTNDDPPLLHLSGLVHVYLSNMRVLEKAARCDLDTGFDCGNSVHKHWVCKFVHYGTPSWGELHHIQK